MTRHKWDNKPSVNTTTLKYPEYGWGTMCKKVVPFWIIAKELANDWPDTDCPNCLELKPAKKTK